MTGIISCHPDYFYYMCFCLSLVLFNDYGGVVTAESERVGEGCTYRTVLSLVEGEVESVVDVLVLVSFLMVDGWGHNVVLACEH